ncbi:hypothetical protein DTO013E5_9722 [Penicillium roqueforti]|uniref:Uncharacterized protein n=1 Tax=Penicillium roqueforti (strain FM164) TaxID=1365484 RepID=W6QPR9_PENRF|nr:hypothetical protein DTO012A1_9789 [Penicillium roqueforti]CDM38405.1 hypothetical protein PROQFM164_S12g000014 [Penicillium roqueforti FM164]KAI2735628.1 hypothetical protein DTO013F2_10109 [Penicillium roqueforti]KAI2767788.1 hypothetical protein DTO012A8_7003 [Penicillium roqueforti]KAI3063083.1 hypothetical protein CBS147339_9753 [Penicillium roqueforti]
MASNSGVRKTSSHKDKEILSRLIELEEGANNNTISPQKVASGAVQKSVPQGHHPTDGSSEAYDYAPSDSDPTDTARLSPPSNDSVIQSIERDATPSDRDDTPMPDTGLANQTETGSSLSGHQHPSMTSYSRNQTSLSPNFRSDDELQDPELLASLDPSDDDEETDAIVDGWGTLRRSTFVILQYGPRHGARYKVKYRNGYTNDGMNNISDPTLRISLLKTGPGNRSWRYTKHNVVGIYGIASEERDPNKIYMSDPCTWLKIKWRDLRVEDTQKMQNSCSWIPISSFIRFCKGKRAAYAKIKEVWNKQEERYQRVLQSDSGGAERRTEDRSPTPFPLGSAARQSPERQGASHLSAPAIQIFPPRQHQSPPSNAHVHPGQGSLSNPINIDRDETHYTSASSGISRESTVNPQAGPKLSIGGSAILNKEHFIAERAEEEGWHNMDERTRAIQKTIAEALYHVYQDTVAATRRAQGPVVGSILPEAETAVAAY